MSYTSRFISLTDFCLLEWRYTDPSAPESMSNDFYRVENSYTGNVHILNVDSEIDTTGNVQERSALEIASGAYADLDKDQVPTYLDYDTTALTVTTVVGDTVAFDEVVFHFLAGYNFEDSDGVVFEVRAKDRASKTVVLSQLAVLVDSDFVEFSARPILLGDRLYDRYVSVKVPSVKLAQEVYDSLDGSPSQGDCFAAMVSSDGTGFMPGALMEIRAITIGSTTELAYMAATYQIYNRQGTRTAAMNQSDDYGALGAVIQRSEGGDYFEYFASWDGGFIEDFIGANTFSGNRWAVIHELRVIEQVGSEFTTTAYMQFIQEEYFDQPNLFRPIVLSAEVAVAYSIEYTARLYNKKDASQVIRTASFTGYDPKTWGRNLERIKLLYEPQPYKVYNKVVDGPVLPVELFARSSDDVVPYTTRIVPSFFERNLLSLSLGTMFVGPDGTLQRTSSVDSRAIYGQGDCRILLTPFDNWMRFTLFKEDQTRGGAPAPLDLGTGAQYYLAFVNNDGTKLRYARVSDATLGDPQKGDLVFKVPGEDAPNILKNTNKEFYLVSRGDDGSETSIYQGLFDSPDNMEAVKEANAAVIAQANAVSEAQAVIAAAAEQAAAADVAVIAASGSDQGDASKPTLPSGVKIPSNVKPQTLSEIKPKAPGSGSSFVSSKTSILSQMKPKAPNKVKKEESPAKKEKKSDKKKSA